MAKFHTTKNKKKILGIAAGVAAFLVITGVGFAFNWKALFVKEETGSYVPTEHQEQRWVEHKPQTNEVNSKEDLINGNWYKVNTEFNDYQSFYEMTFEFDKIVCPAGNNNFIIYINDNIGHLVREDYYPYSWLDNNTDYYFDDDNGLYMHLLNFEHNGRFYNSMLSKLTEEELALIPSTYELETVTVYY